MTLTIRKVIQILKAQWVGTEEVAVIDCISIDSRSLQNDVATLFVAIEGPHHNGHEFIEGLYERGVRYFVVTKVPPSLKGKGQFLVVENTLQALQTLAAFHRSLFDFPIIGITGSNGKTIVKEWLNFLLSPDYHVIRSPKSYNSQVGVPLSVLGINENHNFGIFEAGISEPNEMAQLEQIIQPNIGILTNIGSAHDEGFANAGEKIKEKTRLFQSVSLLIMQKNKSLAAFINPKIKTFTWSFNDHSADVFVQKRTLTRQSRLNITYGDQCFSVLIPFTDDASVQNSLHCLMVLLYLGYELEQIQQRLLALYPVEMRLRVKNGIHHTLLIDDSYSSDFQSLRIALDFLENQKQNKKKTVILSDIFQSGLSEEELYAQVSQLIISNKINRVIGIGPTIFKYRKKFINCVAFASMAEFYAAFDHLHFEQETILIKGARDFRFEEIVTLLEQKNHETVLEINLNAISHNYNFYKSKLAPNTRMMVMVKAFGYGNGGVEIARLLEYHKVDYLGVAFADEGISLKEAGIQVPIMVMNPESTAFSAIIAHELEPEIYSLKGFKTFLELAHERKLKAYPIHLKLDTGMHRLGFSHTDLTELIALLQGQTHLEVRSILSHLSASDDLFHKAFTHQQIIAFTEMSDLLAGHLPNTPLRHILNTSGISNFPEAQLDMVRLGIGLYGISNDRDEQKQLERVGTLKSVISQLHHIPAGDSVGYGRRYMADENRTIATIPIGYADGIRRSWGNGVGYIWIHGQKAPIVGSVCMDMLMADVTGIDCKEGNTVILLGEQPSVQDMADALGTIPYEILTGISQRVKRVFYRE